MTRKLVKWASNDGQIIKSGLSDGRRAKFLPSVVGFAYDWLRYECHLGNVGWYYVLTRMPLSTAFPIAAGSLIVAVQIVGYRFLGESLALMHLGGILLILLGIGLLFATTA